MSSNDRLDAIEHLISIRNVHSEDQELFKLILEELRMLRGQNVMTERLETAMRREFQR